MLKRLLQIVSLLLILCLLTAGGLIYYIRTEGLEFTIDEAQLQAKLSKFFPLEVEYSPGVTVLFFDPRLVWQEGEERLEFGMRAVADVQPLEREFTGSARVSGIIRFHQATGEFFLEDSRVEDIDVLGVPMLFMVPIREVADTMVQDHLNREPLYQLEGPLRGVGWLAMLPGVEVREVEMRHRSLMIRVGI